MFFTHKQWMRNWCPNLLSLSPAEEAGGGSGASASASTSDPATSPGAQTPVPAPNVLKVSVDGREEEFDQNRVIRNYQQAREANKLTEKLRQLEAENAALKAKSGNGDGGNGGTLPATLPTTTDPSDTIRLQGDVEDFRRLVREMNAEDRARQDWARAMAEEGSAARAVLREYGITPDDPQLFERAESEVKAILSQGIKDEKGQLIPGTAAVDENGRPIPASAELAKKAAQYYIDSTIGYARKFESKKLGRQPDAPPMTGTGTTANLSGPQKSVFTMSEAERRAANKAWLQQSRAGQSGATMSGAV